MANTGEITQSVLELLTLQPGSAQITQSVFESLVGLGIFCGNPPNGQFGRPYSHAFPAGGGTPPYTFAITAGTLPPGLALDPVAGVVSGTPVAGGVYAFTVQVSGLPFVPAAVNCSITIFGFGTIKITLRGVKLRRKDCGADEPKISDVMPEVSKVDRAL